MSFLVLSPHSLCFFWFTTERFVARKLRCEYCSINFLTLKMSNFYGIVTLNDKLTWQKKEKRKSKRVRKERKRGKQTCWLCHSNDFLKLVQGLFGWWLKMEVLNWHFDFIAVCNFCALRIWRCFVCCLRIEVWGWHALVKNLAGNFLTTVKNSVYVFANKNHFISEQQRLDYDSDVARGSVITLRHNSLVASSMPTSTKQH